MAMFELVQLTVEVTAMHSSFCVVSVPDGGQ